MLSPGIAFTGAGPAAAQDGARFIGGGQTGTAAPRPHDPPAPPLNPLKPRDGSGMTAAQRAAVTAAQHRASSSGSPVTVDALTTETSTVTAEPSGALTSTTALLPVRVRKGGAWTAVDPTLVRNGDGTYSPRAAAGPLTLSGGGSTAPLAAMGSGRKKLAFGWPGALPAPTVSGPALTYADVLPGVDLKVTATTLGGFSEILVVKSAAAAADPGLARLALSTRATGVTVHDDGRHGLEAVSPDGSIAFSAPRPMMWDSSRTSGARAGFRPSATARAAVDGSVPADAAPPAGARTAWVGARPGGGSLALSPDRGMLTDKDTVFPVYIDPTWNPHDIAGNKQHYEEVQAGCPTATGNWDHTPNGDPGVGDNTYSGCVGVERSYFQLGIPSTVWGAHIVEAKINITETYAAQCDTTSTINIYQTSAINKAFSWNTKPSPGSKIGSASFPPACSSYESKAVVATGTLVRAAADHASSIAYVMINGSETNGYHFKRFATNPSVTITYNHVPNTPGSLALKLNSASYGCATATPYPILGKTVATTPPLLDSVTTDTDQDALQATYTYWAGSGTHTTMKSANVSSGQHAPATFPSTWIKSLADGTVVSWQVSATDGEDAKANSSTCHFTVDQRAPAEPTVTSSGSLYPDIDNGGAAGAAAGTTGTFVAHVDPGTTGNNASKFVFGLDAKPPTSSPPAGQVKTASGNSAPYDATPIAPGTHTLFVYALDSAGNESPMHEYRFTAVGHTGVTKSSLSAAFNNTAVSDNATPTAANADGAGNSFSLQELEAAGWNPGQHITVDGADFTLPNFGSGPDNVLASNQTITMSGEQGDALVFLATSTNANSAQDHEAQDHSSPYIPDGTSISATNCSYSDNVAVDCSEASGTITYGQGTAPQSYYLPVPDWTVGSSDLSVLALGHRNTPTSQSSLGAKVYAISVPLAKGAPVASVTLPDIAGGVSGRTPGLHIFGMAVRDTTTAPSGHSWTGAWSSPSESGAYNFVGTGGYHDQSVRAAVRPSVSGDSLRIKLSNRGGVAPLSLDDVTFAPQSSGSVAATTPTSLTFGGSTSVLVPVGGEVYSDPLAVEVTADHPVLVSFHLANTVAEIPEHSYASAIVNYVSAPGTGDHAADISSTAFTQTGTVWGYFSDILTGLDVTTDGDQPTVDSIGDNLVDAGVSGTHAVGGGAQGLDANWRLASSIATAVQGNAQGVPEYGVVAGDIAKNHLDADMPGAHNGGRSLLNRLDYDVLAEPNLTTVIINQGLQDIVAGSDDTSITASYQTLLDQLQAWGIRTVILNLTPCEGYAGCTAASDDNRLAVNEWISDVSAANWPGCVNVDVNAAVAVDDPNSVTDPPQQQLSAQTAPLDFDSSDHVNLSLDGYAALSGTITSDLTVLMPPPQ